MFSGINRTETHMITEGKTGNIHGIEVKARVRTQELDAGNEVTTALTC